MSHGRRFAVDLGAVEISVREWGSPGAQPLITVGGTGLPSELFLGVEQLLESGFHGFSIDRRSQGHSSTPEDGYDFSDFAGDLREVVERLDLRNIVGLGHSAGGTDMLLAAATAPDRWERLTIMEPTLQDPRIPPLNETRPPTYQRALANAQRRRVEFPGITAAIERWKVAPNFRRARPDLFRSYVEGCFEPTTAGTVRLRCHPGAEAKMLAPIMQVFQRRYRPPAGRPDPFRPLLDLRVPVTLVTTEFSGGYYAEMVRRGLSMLPNARHVHLDGVGHLVPLEKPEAVANLARG